MTSPFTSLQSQIEVHLRDRFQQLDTQLYRLKQSQERIEELAKAKGDQAQRKLLMARKEQDILRKNLDMLKSRCRSEGLKQILPALVPFKQNVEALTPADWGLIHTAFSQLYVGKTAANESENQNIEAVLNLIWAHLKTLCDYEMHSIDLQAENESLKTFRQQRFHPLEKMALTQFHGLIAQMRLMTPAKKAADEAEASPSKPSEASKNLEIKSHIEAAEQAQQAPKTQTDVLQRDLSLVQRKLFQMRSRLRMKLGENLRKNLLAEISDAEQKQNELYSALRQWLVWNCLQSLLQYRGRFDTLGEHMDKALELSHSLSIGERAAYVKQVLTKDLYQLYLDCRQTQLENNPLKSLDYIENQQNKVARLGFDDFEARLEQLLKRDESLILSLQKHPYILPAEVDYLGALRPPLHRIIERLDSLNLKAS